MKKSVSISLVGIILAVVIFVSGYFIIFPGVKELNEISNIKELTFDEKTKLIDDVNKKYDNLEVEIDNKYSGSINDIESKYKNLENQIKEETKKKISELDEKINNKNVEQDNEFWKNQLSKKYYDLGTELSNLKEEKWDVEIKEREDISKNNTNKRQELEKIEENKKLEKDRLNEKKQNEINEINTRNTDTSSIKSKSIKNIISGIVIILIPIIYIVLAFNRLTTLLNSVKKYWSQVDVLLKQRADLIPNIVNTVKGYSKHEQDTLTNVISARNEMLNATSKEEEMNANKKMNNSINRLLALQEDYPELKADKNYMSLHNDLRQLEDEIADARNRYNNSVLKYKNKLEIFPSNVIASIFNFKPELFFQIDDEEKDNPKVEF